MVDGNLGLGLGLDYASKLYLPAERGCKFQKRSLLYVAGILLIVIAALHFMLSVNTGFVLLSFHGGIVIPSVADIYKTSSVKVTGAPQNSDICFNAHSNHHYHYAMSDDPTIFTSSLFPSNSNQQPSIGNGFLATVIYSDTVYVNGLYNGKGTSSHRVRVPSTAAINVSLQEIQSSASELYTLDVGKGIFVHHITTDEVEVTHRMYAHQVLNRLLVNQIIISRKSNKSDEIKVRVDTNFGQKSKDINFKETPTKNSTRKMYGKVITPEHDSTEVIMTFVYWTDVPSCITLPKDILTKQYTFISSISKMDDDAQYFYKEGLKMAENDELYVSHITAWKTKWQKGHVAIDNNIYLSRVIYSSMYYILSSLPPLNTTDRLAFPFYGLAPGGLANGGGDKDYMGHVFWDQETWMYPSILLFHPTLAKAMLNSRTRHIEAAKDLANVKGYNGTLFPWEMAYSGYDVCPDRTVAKFEQHVNGDIAYALQQYVKMTEDVNFLLHDRGFDLAKGLAEFWFSRIHYNNNKTRYEINGVMPPDEYHYNVNNSVYTNMVAKISLLLPEQLAQILNTSVPEYWSDAGKKLYIPFDDVMKYHPEYDGYKLGTVIKQADVILLGFPLMYDMPVEVQVNDLMFYEQYRGKAVTNPDGPAMTWAMYTINWLKLKNFAKANEVFNKTFANIQEPFMTWTENPDGTGAVNFQTGMGGFLQAITFGFGGIRIGKCLNFDFVLPVKSTTFNITGLNYLGSSLDFVAKDPTIYITLVEVEVKHSPNLQLIVSSTEVHTLKIGQTVKIQRKLAKICKTTSS